MDNPRLRRATAMTRPDAYGLRVTARFGAPRPASALGDSQGSPRERCDRYPAIYGYSPISKRVSRAAGRTDVLKKFPAPLSREPDSWHGGMVDQLSSHQWYQRS